MERIPIYSFLNWNEPQLVNFLQKLGDSKSNTCIYGGYAYKLIIRKKQQEKLEQIKQYQFSQRILIQQLTSIHEEERKEIKERNENSLQNIVKRKVERQQLLNKLQLQIQQLDREISQLTIDNTIGDTTDIDVKIFTEHNHDIIKNKITEFITECKLNGITPIEDHEESKAFIMKNYNDNYGFVGVEVHHNIAIGYRNKIDKLGYRVVLFIKLNTEYVPIVEIQIINHREEEYQKRKEYKPFINNLFIQDVDSIISETVSSLKQKIKSFITTLVYIGIIMNFFHIEHIHKNFIIKKGMYPYIVTIESLYNNLKRNAIKIIVLLYRIFIYDKNLFLSENEIDLIRIESKEEMIALLTDRATENSFYKKYERYITKHIDEYSKPLDVIRENKSITCFFGIQIMITIIKRLFFTPHEPLDINVLLSETNSISYYTITNKPQFFLRENMTIFYSNFILLENELLLQDRVSITYTDEKVDNIPTSIPNYLKTIGHSVLELYDPPEIQLQLWNGLFTELNNTITIQLLKQKEASITRELQLLEDKKFRLATVLPLLKYVKKEGRKTRIKKNYIHSRKKYKKSIK